MKHFFEVFESLHLKKEYAEIFKKVVVRDLVLSKDQTSLKVYLESEFLIDKDIIFEVESCIKKQILAKKAVKVTIIETFHLSSQYNIHNLLEAYKKSILIDIMNKSPLEHSIVANATWEMINENTLYITVEDTIISRAKGREIALFIEDILTNRCGFLVATEMIYSMEEREKRQELRRIKEEKERAQIPELLYDLKHLEKVQEEHATSKNQNEAINQSDIPIKEDKKVSHIGKREEPAKKQYSKRTKFKYPDSDRLIYGNNFTDEYVLIVDCDMTTKRVAIRGQIFDVDIRETPNINVVQLSITDFTDSVIAKMFLKNDELESFNELVHKGDFLELFGDFIMDSYISEESFTIEAIRQSSDFREKRMDNAIEKRVELHCHTKMSERDSVVDCEELIKTCIKWGHSAVAITDHGVTHAFPSIYHLVDKAPIKAIYGMEGYLVDDENWIVTNGRGQTFDDTFVVFDIETTGLNCKKDKIIEIGAVKIAGGKVIDRFSAFVNPLVPIPLRISNLTGIMDKDVIGARQIEEELVAFLAFCENAVLVAHNAEFDMGFIKKNASDFGIDFEPTYIDTVAMARVLFPHMSRYRLDTLAKELKIELLNHHRAVDDAECTSRIFLKLVEKFRLNKVNDLTTLQESSQLSIESIKKKHPFHIVLLAKNIKGKENLYKLVSESHLHYMHRKPLIPRSLLRQYREGLLLGSACSSGELFEAVMNGKSDIELEKIVNFYDYIEIQPVENNRYLYEERGIVKSFAELYDLNKELVALGEKFQKPVVATCDVHFFNPEDAFYRSVLFYEMKKNALEKKSYEEKMKGIEQAPLYFRTTEEMLEEFSYLGIEKAYEVVVTNTNKIADQIEKFRPLRKHNYPPVIENADEDLRKICETKAKEWYGNPIPTIILERMEKELDSIIKNGYAVMYIIAQKLVTKSLVDGYVVGSRGSVGSSFVATLAGITEVNPLPAHYRCPKCQYNEFVQGSAGITGCDLPAKSCPVCGEHLIKDGFDIPFETFLGFEGNAKEPDIDLNFSGDYQAKAHAYTEVIFGEGQTFRAGTLSVVAEKTAFGYVLGYCEAMGINKRGVEKKRLAKGCEGVRRTTGQHPGGIIVLPYGEDITTFTPIQHPPKSDDIITTHYDYHSIDSNLLKLDILGHDDPTMIRMIQDLTGKDPTQFPLDDEKVMTLFRDTTALGITPEDISNCPLGSLGIPEMGTDFVIGMLVDTKPSSLADLVRISGLSHGTNVWLGNTADLIRDGVTTLAEAISTRDDIMTYLIHKGLESSKAFQIMESVRKGKGLRDDWEEDMLAHDVPEWYVESAKKIKYMFPKAHAAAYVMMAWRIAYCKVYYPLAYYTAYFTIRAVAFSYETMCNGLVNLREHMANIKYTIDLAKSSNSDKKKKDEDTYKDMRIVEEMYARGFEFMPIDIYKAKAKQFQLIDGKIMPSLMAVDGLGETAARQLEIEAKKSPFLSKAQLKKRTGLTANNIETLSRLGLIDGMSESNQLTLFESLNTL